MTSLWWWSLASPVKLSIPTCVTVAFGFLLVGLGLTTLGLTTAWGVV